MRRRLFIAAIALVILANISVFAKVIYNRSTIISSIELSERELSSLNLGNKPLFNHGLYLRWEIASDHFKSIASSPTTMAAFNFAPDCQAYRNKKSAYALLQLNGQAYQNHAMLNVQRLEENQGKLQSIASDNTDWQFKQNQKDIERWKSDNTRLYVIAVHPDAQHLRSLIRHPQQEFISKAIVSGDCKNTRIQVHDIHPQSLHITKSQLPSPPPKKFTATVHIGSLGDAWLQSVIPSH